MAAVPFERIDADAPQLVPAANAILTVDDIVKRFETPDGVLTAIDHVSLSVAPAAHSGRSRAEADKSVQSIRGPWSGSAASSPSSWDHGSLKRRVACEA